MTVFFSAKMGFMQRGRKSVTAMAMVPVDGSPSPLRPPASLNKAERAVFIHVSTSVRPEHFQPCDQPLLVRYCEVVAMCDYAAKKLAADIAKSRPSHWLSTHAQLTKTQRSCWAATCACRRWPERRTRTAGRTRLILTATGMRSQLTT